MRAPHPKRVDDSRAHPLVRLLYEIIREQQAAVTDVAERAGLSHVTLVKWRTSYAPTVVALEAALNVLGYRLAIVPDTCKRQQDYARYERHARDTHDPHRIDPNGRSYNLGSQQGAPR